MALSRCTKQGETMTKDEALKLALEALEAAYARIVTKCEQNLVTYNGVDVDTLTLSIEAITAIKKTLAQPEQCQCPNCRVTLHASDCAVHNEPAYPKGECNCGAQPEQEPVAWGVFEGNLHDMFFSPSEAQEMADLKGTHAEVRPLYTTPPQRKPQYDKTKMNCFVQDLYDKKIQEGKHGHYEAMFHVVHRAIEAAHGIKE